MFHFLLKSPARMAGLFFARMEPRKGKRIKQKNPAQGPGFRLVV